MRYLALLGLLFWCAPAHAQQQAGGSIVNLISTAPQAQTPGSASDLYLVIEAGIVKKVLGTQLSTMVLTNLASTPLANLPLAGGDSLVVVQDGLAKRVRETSTLNMAGMAVGGAGLTVSGPAAFSGPATFTGAATFTGPVTLPTSDAGLAVDGPFTVTSPVLTIDRLGNITGLTHTLRPTLKPPIPAGGNFVLYVDAFDKSLYVRGWLGTVTRIARP